jgi:hypothetical protein
MDGPGHRLSGESEPAVDGPIVREKANHEERGIWATNHRRRKCDMTDWLISPGY